MGDLNVSFADDGPKAEPLQPVKPAKKWFQVLALTPDQRKACGPMTPCIANKHCETCHGTGFSGSRFDPKRRNFVQKMPCQCLMVELDNTL